ncbi:MAG: diphthamide biosynthesis enzyme Dph2 [Candidatus Aenigmatarchaeota archaeon]
MKILLQIPEGLKTRAIEIAKELESRGDKVVISCDPCYGACDLKEKEARELGCEKIIHYGHTKFLENRMPVLYEEIKESMDPAPILNKDFEKIEKHSSFGLVSSLQFVDSLKKAKSFLEKKAKQAHIGKGILISKKLYPGQILGCDISAAKAVESKVDCFLFFGSGRFHPLGLALSTEKPVYFVDMERKEIENLNSFRRKFLNQRYAASAMLKHARTIGILVSTKSGQRRIELAENIREELKKRGRNAFILSMDEISPEKLAGLKLDAFINTACPRIAIEHRTQFDKPIVNPDEI